MFVVKKAKEKVKSLPTLQLRPEDVKAISSELSQRILKELAKEPSYPYKVAKKLKENEQKIYYHFKNLEKSRIIEIIKKEKSNIYSLRYPSATIIFEELRETKKLPGIEESPSRFLEPFVQNGELNANIIVGSPDPHGPEKARSRDGYYGMDFALFLGTFLNYIPELKVLLDTEVKTEDLTENLILIGGPVVNNVTGKINDKLDIKFDKKKRWEITSSITGKTYESDEAGIIVKTKNPFNRKKKILLIAGKRHSGTKAVMIAFLKHFKEISKGNKFENTKMAKIVEGIDKDYDGIVDDIEFLE